MISKALRPVDDSVGTVTRVIDGDTLVAQVGATESTIRLLNVDTPETKDPNKPVECLGAEATNFLRGRLPTGTPMTVEYDRERTDRYDRTLAGVFEAGSLVNAEIAAAGWGVAVMFEPNDKFYDAVVAAQLKAEDRHIGLFNATAECTLPGLVREATTAMQDAGKSKPSTSAEARAAARAVSSARSSAKQLYRKIKNDTLFAGSVVLSSYSSSFRAEQVKELKLGIKTAKKRHTKLAAKTTQLKAGEKRRAEEKRRAAEERRLEKERRAVEKRERAAQEKREAEERRQGERRREKEAQRAEQRQAEEDYEREYDSEPQPTDADEGDEGDEGDESSDDGASGNDDSSYNGPRCYAPGGKSWKPC